MGNTDKGNHDDFWEISFINIQPGVPIGMDFRLNSPPNSMTFVDGSNLYSSDFLTITLGKGVDFIIQVRLVIQPLNLRLNAYRFRRRD